MENIFIKNLKEFLKKQAITQTQFARQMGISNASVSNYLSGQNEPSLSFLQNLKSNYEISIDEFLTKNYSKQEHDLTNQNLARFIGNYLLYFYDTSAYVGSIQNLEKNLLRHGVLCIRHKDGKLIAHCAFFKELESAIKLKDLLDNAPSQTGLSEMLLNTEIIAYKGNVEASQTQIFISLKSFDDQSLIILNNPPSNKTYIGGFGTVNSVSRGREHMPSIQFILIARQQLPLPEGELYNLLALNNVDVSLHNQADRLLSLFKNLYLSENETVLNLEEFQKKKIFESSLQNIIADIIETNVFRFAKISAKVDDEYYNLIKKGVR